MLAPEYFDFDKAMHDATEQQLLEALLAHDDPSRKRVRHDAPWRPDVSHLDDAEEGSAGDPIDLLRDEEDGQLGTASPAEAAVADAEDDELNRFLLQPSLGDAFVGQ